MNLTTDTPIGATIRPDSGPAREWRYTGNTDTVNGAVMFHLADSAGDSMWIKGGAVTSLPDKPMAYLGKGVWA